MSKDHSHAMGRRTCKPLLGYHFPVHPLTRQLLNSICKQHLLKAGDRVGVAVSGGADSVALLLLLLELRAEIGIVLSVVHVNHQLRGGESDEDERFVAAMAQQQGLELHSRTMKLERPDSGMEAAARRLRYDFFRQLVRDKLLSHIATAHTLDDQAETVLLRMLRGTGIRGLAGIHPRLDFTYELGAVVRPLLSIRRDDLKTFLREREQPWREDSSNQDVAHLRNRVRHRLLPLITEEFGAAGVGNLADLAEIARAEEEHWDMGHPEISKFDGNHPENLSGLSVVTLPLAAQRRLLREWLEANVEGMAVSFRLIEELRALAFGSAGRKVELPGAHIVTATKRGLCFERAGNPTKPPGYEYRLPVPGTVEVPELGIRLEAMITNPDIVPQDERERLLDPARLPQELLVRNWRAGDRFWPAHSKEEKKVKELLSDRHIRGTEKARWPVVFAEGCGLVWMRGLPAPATLQSPGGSSVLWLKESRLG